MMPRKFLSTFPVKLSSEPLWWSHLHGPSLRWRACLEGHPTDKKHRFLEVFRTPNITCCASEPSVPTGQNHGKLHQQQRTKLETVLSLAIHLQRANLVVGSQQEPSLVALNEDQRTKRTEGRVGDKIQWCVWRFHSNLKHSSCASDISSNPSRDQIWDSNASHEDPCALGSKPLWNHLHWPSGGWSTCSAQGGTSKRALA